MPKPYSKLRGKMAELGITGEAMSNFLGKNRNYVYQRLAKNSSWSIDEVYKIMEYLKIPQEEIFIYFPPNGGTVQKGKVCR